MKRIIGFRGVLDALHKGNINHIVIDPSKKGHHKVKGILKLAGGIKVKFEDTEAGIEAFVESFSNNFKEILEKLALKKKSIVVALDGIQDTGNLGSIIRTSDAFSVDLIILPNKNSAQITDKVIKISSGSSANVPMLEVANLASALEDLKRAGFWIYGSEGTAEKSYKGTFDMKSCIVMGNESEGMRNRTKEICDFLVKIPIREGMDSLNVSSACGVMLSEAYHLIYGE